MSRLSTSKHVAAAPDDVFRILTNLREAPEHIRGITKLEVLTDGPIGVGTRFRETRVVFKREHTEEMEITAFEPGKGYTVGCQSCGCAYTSVFRMEPRDGGTTVHVDFETRPLTFMAKLMSPLGKLMAGSCMKMFEQDLEDLKAVAEGSGGRPAGAAPPA